MHNIYFYFYIPYNMLSFQQFHFPSVPIQLIPFTTTHQPLPLLPPSPNHYSGLCKDAALELKQKTKAMQLDPQALESD